MGILLLYFITGIGVAMVDYYVYDIEYDNTAQFMIVLFLWPLVVAGRMMGD